MDSKVRKAIELYRDQQWPMAKVCKYCKIAPKTLRKKLIEYGVPIRSRNETRERNLSRDLLYQEYCIKGKSVKDIADEFGYANGTVHNYLKKYGFNNRTWVESKALKSDNYTVWTEEMEEQAKNMLKGGFTCKDVAEHLGVTENSVSDKNCKIWKIPLNTWSKINPEPIKKMLNETRDYQKTADFFILMLK